MNINEARQEGFQDFDEAWVSRELDQLVASIAQNMAKEYFPEQCQQDPGGIPGPTDSGESQKDNACPKGLSLSGTEQPEDPGRHCLSPLLPCSELQPVDEWARPPHVHGCKPPAGLDVYAIRRDFPILFEKVNGKQLVWFDNAATTQKPKSVIDRIAWFYAHENSNVHRAAHTLASRATDAYESAREKAAAFLHAQSPEEIIFVRGATEGINLVAQSYGLYHLERDDEVIVTMLEHHANIVPWQMVCERTGAKLKAVPVDDDGQVMLEEYGNLLSGRTKLVALTQVSNALGTVTPVLQMVRMAHDCGARTLVDGAQAVAHMPVDVQALDCDFYVFSGHKVFGPMGAGVVYGKSDVLQDMPPYQGGGSMISDVTMEKSMYKAPPHRFEAGTGSIGDAVGLGAAIDYVTQIGMDRIEQYERFLYAYAAEAMQTVKGLTLLGAPGQKTGILPFTLKGISPEETGQYLNREGIAVRTGHHCAQPILKRFGLNSVVRASLAFYNTPEEIDRMAAALKKLSRT